MALVSKACLICEKALGWPRAPDANLCASAQCRWTFDRTPAFEKCCVCSKPLAGREKAARRCSRFECQQAFVSDQAAVRARKRLEYEEIRAQAEIVRADSAAALGIAEPTKYTLAIIPSYEMPLVELPMARRFMLAEHVARIVRKAMSEPAPGDANPTPTPEPTPIPERIQPILGKACGLCKGNCCRGGGNWAYLTDATIRRFCHAHPQLDADQVVAAYLARMVTTTYENSCVFHQRDGCGLTREMRSDTCNLHFCQGLFDFQKDVSSEGPVEVFFAAIRDYRVAAAMFVDEAGTGLVSIAPAETPAST